MKKLRAVLVLAAVAALSVGIADAASARTSGFAPDAGHYTGSATVKGKKANATAKVAKKGSGYSVLVGVAEPGECFDAALGASIPLSVAYEFTAPLSGSSIDFNGTGKILGGQIGNKSVALKVDGHFTGTDAFVATVKSTIAAESGNANSTKCTVPTLNFKFKKG